MEQAQALLDRRDDADGSRRRDQPRCPYRIPTGLRVDYVEANRDASWDYLIPRDLSSSGLGGLHRGHIAAGTSVTVHLPVAKNDVLPVAGRVVRSYSLAHGVYDIGIAFAAPVDTSAAIARARQLVQAG